MSLIHVLDESTINQIAAGEVVERPSAVVKELIENAMDAGATAITAEIKEGGLSLIRITDNGSGIAKEDVPLAFLRHATSKIRSAEDLLSVTSLGFRGEALSSIASVAQVELITKTPTALNGLRYIIEGGEEKTFEEIGSPTGTTIIVRNIFYNTPARRKFLKSATTKANYISDLMERLIVSHPNVSFKFIVNNQVKLQSSGNNSSRDILYSIYGRDISKELVSIELNTEAVKVTGFIGKPVINRGNRNFENYFINGRYIKSNIITKAIEEAYKPFLMQHKYPFTSIYFAIDPALIDVNVHPQKMEIRLNNGEDIYQLTYELIRNALLGKEMIPKVTLTQEPEEKKTVQEKMPEPFEHNRRSASSSSYKPGRAGDYTPSRIGERPVDYITATKPLIHPHNPLSEVLTGNRKDFVSSLEQAQGTKDRNKSTVCEEQQLITSRDGEVEGTSSITIASGLEPKPEQESSIALSHSLDPNPGQKSSIALSHSLDTNPRQESSIALSPSLDYKPGQERDKTPSPNLEYKAETASRYEYEIAVENKSDLMKDTVTSQLAAANEAFIETGTEEADPIQKEPRLASAQELPSSAAAYEAAKQLKLFSESNVEGEAPFLSQKAFEEHRIIGQVFSTYWLVEYKKDLYIIDQHAAHEKVLYEKLMQASREKTYSSQQLLPPIVLSLTLKEQEILQKHETVLNSLGYEFEHFGGKEYSVRAVPANLYSLSEKELLLEFIDALADENAGGSLSSVSILEKAASLSCKAAVKANHSFSFEEATALIKELLTLENPYHCPHGRPVIVSMSQYELERKFKRIL